VGGGVALMLVAVLVFALVQPIQVLPRIRLAPGFALTDQSGAPLTSEDLRGSFTVYSFTYTSCPPPCGGIMDAMQRLQDELRTVDTGGVDVRMVTLSVDPDHDSPDVLRSYAAALGADPTRWRFATTTDEPLLKAIVGGGFNTYFERQTDGSIALHPAAVLVDGSGIIRGEYRFETREPLDERLARHLAVLGDEVQNSKGAAALAYEAAHFFRCYAG
jgi:protein SCO1/2